MQTRQQSPKDKRRTTKKSDPHDTKMPRGAVVGRDVPDESKEHHTEIAVEVGQKVGADHKD